MTEGNVPNVRSEGPRKVPKVAVQYAREALGGVGNLRGEVAEIDCAAGLKVTRAGLTRSLEVTEVTASTRAGSGEVGGE